MILILWLDRPAVSCYSIGDIVKEEEEEEEEDHFQDDGTIIKEMMKG
jgi:hypothetical protein